MSTDRFPQKISTNSKLGKVIAQRAQHIVFASDFKPWPNKKNGFYNFLAPNPSGIHVCERLYHPGSSRLAGFEDLCDLILGGSEVVIELTPESQQAVRFCEMLLATLYEDMEARKIAHLPFAQEVLKNSDWSVQDGIGPCTLHSPAVIGYSAPKNLKKYSADKPAVIWSKFWQLSTDPIDSLLKRVGQIIEEHSRSLKPSSSKRYTPPAMDAWIDRAILELRPWVEDRRKFPTIALDELTYAQLPILPSLKRPEKEQVEAVCEKLGSRIREKNLHQEWSVMFRAPASSMYDKASLSFRSIEKPVGDCWGYPFAFDLAFGSGVVKVRCEGLTALNKPDVAVSTVTTPEQQLAVVEERPDDLLTIAEAAKYANVSTRTIRSWLGAKQANDKPMLPGVVRTDRIVNIPRGDLEPWRKKQKSKRKYTGSRSKKKKA